MFEQVKKGVNLLEHISEDLQLDVRECGTDTYQIDEERDNGGCPFCGHMDCFKMFYSEDTPEDAGYKCFSCDVHGSVIDWQAARYNMTPAEAAIALAKKYNIDIPRLQRNPIQEVFNLAAAYYENCLWETCLKPLALLGGLSPVEYQLNVRKHSEAILHKLSVGWSDGGLVDYLESIDIDPDLITQSGLRAKSGKGDFLPGNVFVYPHTVKNRVSHFTFKDPAKRLAWQLPNKFVLNDHMFANQDSLEGAENIIIVEGENDLLSIADAVDFPLATAVIGTIGSVSGNQLNWLREKFGGMTGANILTLFDPDEAGDKYRAKFDKMGKLFKSLVQIRLDGECDIDEILSSGGSLTEVLATGVRWTPPAGTLPPWETSAPTSIVGSAEVSTGSVDTAKYTPDASLEVPGEGTAPADLDTVTLPGLSVVQQGMCYYKIKPNKDEAPSYIKISDFVIKLRNIFIGEDGKRNREVIIMREDGFKSKPILITSETKTTLKSFRVLLADVADADFKGSDHDLIDVWKLVYTQPPQGTVSIVRHVGRNENFKGWVFGNVFIHDSGAEILPDSEGIFWLPGGKAGLRPENLTQVGSACAGDIPLLYTEMTQEESKECLQGVLDSLTKNLNSIWKALILVGWAKACIYSNWIHPNKEFPFLYLWGTKGEGKTTIMRWVQDFFDMRSTGYSSVRMLGSTNGWGRKVEYYSSLPLLVDEMRTDKETEQYISLFRSYYDRGQRVTALRESFGVRTQDIRSCFTFVGEDMVEDPAFKERCIPLRVPVKDRETKESYRWMEDNRHHFTGITYHWLRESVRVNRDEVRAGVQSIDRRMVDAGATKRTSKNWSVAAYFAEQLAAEFFPEYNFEANLTLNAEHETVEQRVDSTIMQFFEAIENLQAQERMVFNSNHMAVERGKYLHIWHPAIYRIVQDQCRGHFPFSKNAVLSMIRDEPYFVKESKIQMGIAGARRSVLTLDLERCPDTIKNIAEIAKEAEID